MERCFPPSSTTRCVCIAMRRLHCMSMRICVACMSEVCKWQHHHMTPLPAVFRRSTHRVPRQTHLKNRVQLAPLKFHPHPMRSAQHEAVGSSGPVGSPEGMGSPKAMGSPEPIGPPQPVGSQEPVGPPQPTRSAPHRLGVRKKRLYESAFLRSGVCHQARWCQRAWT